MEAILNTIITPLPAWLALVLIVVGAVSLVLGLIRLGYGAVVRTLVLDLIDQAEREIQGTKRGAERKAWCCQNVAPLSGQQPVGQAGQLGNH